MPETPIYVFDACISGDTNRWQMKSAEGRRFTRSRIVVVDLLILAAVTPGRRCVRVPRLAGVGHDLLIIFVCVVVTCQGDAEDDEAVPDKESDIKPRFHKAKSHTQKHDPSADGDQVRVSDV